jgi:hypothetical protein
LLPDDGTLKNCGTLLTRLTVRISARPVTNVYHLLWSPIPPRHLCPALSSETDQLIRVGRLGNLRLQRGYYVYIGSALGPGGVHGRLGHHIGHKTCHIANRAETQAFGNPLLHQLDQGRGDSLRFILNPAACLFWSSQLNLYECS